MSRFPSIRTALVALLLFPGLPAGAATVSDLDMSTIVGLQEGPLDQALDLIGQGKLAEAEAITRRMIAGTPDSAAAHEVLGIILALRDRVPEAITALQRATEYNPRQFTAWTKLGDIAQALGDEAQAMALYRQALAIAPDDRLTNQRVGLYLARQGEVGAAIAHLEKGIIGLPEDPPGLRVDLGRLYLRAGQPQKALDLLAHAADASAQPGPAVLAVLGEALLATGEPAAAAERFRGILAVTPDDVPARIGLGRAERALGDTEASIATLTQVVADAPDDPAAQIELATSEAAAGRGADAMARLDRLVEDARQPTADTLATAARLYGGMAHYDKARDSFARAIAARPDDPTLRAGMAVVLLRLGDTKAALEQSRKRLDLSPDDADAAFMTGMLEESTGDRAAAIARYEQALTDSPDHWPSLNNLAVIRLSEGHIEEALALARRADQAMPENLVVLDTLARIHEAGGDANQAAEARLRIGQTYQAANRTDDARKALQQAAAIATDPALRARITALLEAL